MASLKGSSAKALAYAEAYGAGQVRIALAVGQYPPPSFVDLRLRNPHRGH